MRRYLDEPPSAAELEAALDALGLEPWEIARMGEARARELGLAGLEHDREAWIEVLAANPILIERPIVIGDDGRAALGRPPERVLDLLGCRPAAAAPAALGAAEADRVRAGRDAHEGDLGEVDVDLAVLGGDRAQPPSLSCLRRSESWLASSLRVITWLPMKPTSMRLISEEAISISVPPPAGRFRSARCRSNVGERRRRGCRGSRSAARSRSARCPARRAPRGPPRCR